MPSFGLREEQLSKIAGILLLVGLVGALFGFVSLIPYIQRLPLFRMDTTDACWFTICFAIYLIPLIPVLFLATLLFFGILAAITKGAMLFYKHVILRPGRTILLIWIGIILLYLGCACYATGTELVEFFS